MINPMSDAQWLKSMLFTSFTSLRRFKRGLHLPDAAARYSCLEVSYHRWGLLNSPDFRGFFIFSLCKKQVYYKGLHLNAWRVAQQAPALQGRTMVVLRRLHSP